MKSENILLGSVRGIKTMFLATFVWLITNQLAKGQCPNIQYIVSETVCLGERLLLKNNSDYGLDLEWDFCAGEILNTPTENTLLQELLYIQPFSLKRLTYQGEEYVFVVGRGTSNLVKFKFSGGFINKIESVDLGNPGNLLVNPQGIDIILEGANWIGIVSNFNGSLVRLNFGSSLNNIPSAALIAGVNPIPDSRDIKIVRDNTDFIAVIAGGASVAKISLLDFKSSLLNEPIQTIVQIPNGNLLTGVDVINKCNNWYLLTSGVSSGIHKINFGSSLFNPSPQIFDINGISGPLNIRLLWDIDRLFALVTSDDNGKLYRMDFGTDFDNNIPDLADLGNLGTLNSVIGFDLFDNGTNIQALGIGRVDRKLTLINFPKNCSSNLTFSSESEPRNIFFEIPGQYYTTLTGTDANGIHNSQTKLITVGSNNAPEINFSSENVCNTSVTNFSATNNTPSQTITTWTWDFGDGSLIETGQNVGYQYPNSGAYEVILQAESNEGCSQALFQEIIIFGEPIPNFTVPVGLKCSGQGLLFTNTTNGDYGNVISWTWDFGDGGSSTAKDPVHSFDASGTYNVKLTASIPGCTAETTISVDASEGPAVTYSFANDCFNNSITFTNNTTGTDITGYTWNFGDGTTSNLVNPTHTYAAPGDYTVILTADNALGCSVTNSQTVTVYALPEVAFINELSCSNGTTQFFDQTTAANANITNWAWDFGDGNTSTEKDPAHIYQTSGSFLVSLTATTNFGCTATLEKMVDVIAGPTVDFAIDQVCLGEESQFEDLSKTLDGSAITSRFWEIDGRVFTEQNPTATFALPGTYQTSLTVTSSTFCTATITKDVVINPLPVADFGAENACVNDAVRFIDESIVTGDAIGIYQWNFSNLGNSSDANPVFTFETTGDYVVGLTITTEAGCVSTISKSISILERPEGAFNTDVSQGPPPLMVNFENSSMGADNFNWDFGNGEKSAVTNPIFTFTDLGLFEVIMIASTDAGCADTARQIINIVEPIMDVAIEGMTTLSQDGKTRVSLDIKNNGSLFVDKAEIALEIGSEASVTEILEQTIAPGELVVYPLNISITNRNTTPYLCATLVLPESAFAEANLTNNTYCINLNEKSNVIDPFPNPTDRLITVGVVLEESQKVNISMHNAMGQPVLEREIPEAPEGLNEFQVDVTGIGNGIYWLKLQHGSSEEVFRVFVSK